MGFFSSNSVVPNNVEPMSVNTNTNNLTKEEIAFLINLIKQSTFQGENIESLYNLVLKLQNQYLSLDK
jgi:hypothetical protein